MPVLQRKRRTQPQDDDDDDDDDDVSEPTPGPATQRQRQRQRADDVDSDDERDANQDVSISNIATSDTGQMVKNLVRLALAHEFQRRPIRRADISEKVLGTEGRRFKAVFDLAQEQLRHVFGMELMELPVRDKVTLQQKRAAQKSAASQSAASSTSKSWVLVSILPPRFRTDEVLSPQAAPTAEEEGKYVGIYSLAVSLIILSGGTLSDAKMERYLKKLGLEDTTPVDEYEKTEKLLRRMEKDGYVVKIKENTGTGDDEMYWIVGPRGKVEVGEQGAKDLALHVYGDLQDREEQDLKRRIERSLAMNEKPAQPQPSEKTATNRGRRSKVGATGDGDGRNSETDDDDNDDDDDD